MHICYNIHFALSSYSFILYLYLVFLLFITYDCVAASSSVWYTLNRYFYVERDRKRNTHTSEQFSMYKSDGKSPHQSILFILYLCMLHKWRKKNNIKRLLYGALWIQWKPSSLTHIFLHLYTIHCSNFHVFIYKHDVLCRFGCRL